MVGLKDIANNNLLSSYNISFLQTRTIMRLALTIQIVTYIKYQICNRSNMYKNAD